MGRAGRRKRKRWNAKRRRRQRNREQAFQRGAVGKGELRFDLEVGKLEVVLGHDGL